MEGGVAILLLFIIVVVGGGLAIALYLTGGALWFGKTDPKGDRIEGDDETSQRPRYKRVSSPTIENTELAGTPDDTRAER